MQASKRPRGQSAACCSGLRDLLSPKLFKALSDPRRLALLARMAEAGEPRTVGAIAEGSGVDLSVVSRHLSILREAGVIRCEKYQKEVRCAVETNTLVKVLRDLADAIEACCPQGCGARTSAGSSPRGARTNRQR